MKHLIWSFLQKIVDFTQPLTIFAKHFILPVSQGYEYASDKTKQNPGALSIISQEIRTVIFATFTAQKIKFFINDFFSKCDQIRKKLEMNRKIPNGKLHFCAVFLPLLNSTLSSYYYLEVRPY